MKINISGNYQYIIENGFLKSATGDSFYLEEKNNTIFISNNSNKEGFNVTSTGNININYNNSNISISGNKIIIDGVDMTKSFESKNEDSIKDENLIKEFEIKEIIDEIILSGSAEMKVFNEKLFNSNNFSIKLSGNSYLKVKTTNFDNILSNCSGNSKLFLSDVLNSNLVINLRGNSTLKLVRTSVLNALINGSGNSSILKDKSDIM
jgi:hypothetical protein